MIKELRCQLGNLNIQGEFMKGSKISCLTLALAGVLGFSSMASAVVSPGHSAMKQRHIIINGQSQVQADKFSFTPADASYKQAHIGDVLTNYPEKLEKKKTITVEEITPDMLVAVVTTPHDYQNFVNNNSANGQPIVKVSFSLLSLSTSPADSAQANPATKAKTKTPHVMYFQEADLYKVLAIDHDRALQAWFNRHYPAVFHALRLSYPN
jgi:hypothetical protein